MKAIMNGKIYSNGKFVDGKALVYAEIIHRMIDNDEVKTQDYEEIIDAQGAYVVPGFIDVHIHGYKGCDVMDASEASLAQIANTIVENGVTSFLATTMTMPKADIENALDVVALYQQKQKQKLESKLGAEVLGVHLEGPFINVKYKGAQKEDAICLPDTELIAKYKDIIKIVTIAPEIEGAIDMIETYKDAIRFNVGHSGGDYETAAQAFRAGASGVTHLFNAMTGLHHREPGIVGAALTCNCHTELIADTIHVHPSLYSLILRAKGHEKVLLVTDCISGGGLAEGNYTLGGQAVTVKEGACRLASGTLAGSVLRLNRGLKNLIHHTEYSLGELIMTVTENQANYVGVSHRKGKLENGFDADIVLLDEQINVMKTIVKGTINYEI